MNEVGQRVNSEVSPLSVLSLNTRTKERFKEWPSVWVEGELIKLKTYPTATYGTLRDSDGRAAVEIVMWANAVANRNEFQEADKVVVRGRFDINPSSGKFQFSIQQIKKMGNVKDLMGMIPGMGKAMKDVDIPDDAFKGIEAIILSMTPKERANPALLNPSRKNRIAKGSGTNIQEINKLLKQFEEMRKMMKLMSNPRNMMGMMSKLKGMGGMPGMHRGPREGLDLATLTPGLAKYFGTDKGVLVVAARGDELRAADGVRKHPPAAGGGCGDESPGAYGHAAPAQEALRAR